MSLAVMTADWAAVIESILLYHIHDREQNDDIANKALGDPVGYFNQWARARGHSISDLSIARWCVEEYIPSLAKMPYERLLRSASLDGLQPY